MQSHRIFDWREVTTLSRTGRAALHPLQPRRFERAAGGWAPLGHRSAARRSRQTNDPGWSWQHASTALVAVSERSGTGRRAMHAARFAKGGLASWVDPASASHNAHRVLAGSAALAKRGRIATKGTAGWHGARRTDRGFTQISRAVPRNPVPLNDRGEQSSKSIHRSSPTFSSLSRVRSAAIAHVNSGIVAQPTAPAPFRSGTRAGGGSETRSAGRASGRPLAWAPTGTSMRDRQDAPASSLDVDYNGLSAPEEPTADQRPPSEGGGSRNPAMAGDIVFDGAELGAWMTRYLAESLGSVQTGTAGPDPRIAPPVPGAPLRY